MRLAEYAYRFIAATAGVACHVRMHDAPLPCNMHQQDRRLLFATTLAYEADTLQVVLAEYDGVADVLITENLQPNNWRETEPKPFYLWPVLRNNPWFRVNRSKVFFEACTGSRKSDEMWEQERVNDQCLADAIRKVAKRYDVVVVGSVDEILSRRTMRTLKHCSTLPTLPLSGAIGMPLGKLGRKFQTDWHHAGREHSLSLPTVYSASHPTPLLRHFAPLPGPAIAGGLHMTNYCFLPAIILKELWSTEYGHAFTLQDAKKVDLQTQKETCYNMLAHRVTKGHSPETEVPQMLTQCDAKALPAWYGRTDQREKSFAVLLRQKAAADADADALSTNDARKIARPLGLGGSNW